MQEGIEKERYAFTQLLVENPNYFGTCPEADLAPVHPIQLDTRYEELHCVGFYPEQDYLEAILSVKLTTGYSGPLCSSGSYEYVRFYVDWDEDGDFDEPEEDVGIVSVNVHNIPNTGGPCRDRDKPLDYAVRVKLDPKRRSCKKPYLVKVRAILSWSLPPDPETPDYPPVWGNVLEKWIQIKPREGKLNDIRKFIDWEKAPFTPSQLDLDALVFKAKALSPEALREIYRDKDVPEHRYNLSKLAPIAAQIKRHPSLLAQYKLNPAYEGLIQALQPLLVGAQETKFEELRCVGLHYNRDALMATLTVKRPYGYDGTLCDDGSSEHVAFWAHVYDEIEQQCVWRYLGTASVGVHDIPSIPDEGLQYAVYLSCDFSEWKKPCRTPVVLKIRAVLSWRERPSEIDPYDEPTWGNIVETLIQLKPEDASIPGKQKPYIWSVGEMAVESISGNPYTIEGSALGSGYANGPSINGGFWAVESPFGGIAEITGSIENAPNIVFESDKLKYKVQYYKVGSLTGWHDINNDFKIWVRVNGGPAGIRTQVAAGGYYTYQVDPNPAPKVDVQSDVLAHWDTRSAGGDGLYWLRLLVYKPGAPPQPGVPPDHVSSKIIRVEVDNTPPDAKISLDAGPCTKFKIGDKFTGKFTATDAHIWHYLIRVLPSSLANRPKIEPPASMTYPLLSPPGLTDETFTVTTTASTTPCGYVILLTVRDRTIYNNHFPGRQSEDSVGLCLLQEESE